MIIANYQALDRVCMTAWSTLYRARCLQDGTPVLLRQLDPWHANPVQSARFKREYQLLQSLDVAGLVKPIALIDEHDRLAAIHEDFPGESLAAVLAEGMLLELPICLRIACHLARALDGIHAAHIIHQDIRPANILIERHSGEVRLMNFSIALASEHDTALREDQIASVGDWAYISPEQTGRMNRPVDYRTDFYSLGITLYQMLTGRLPFQGSDPLEWMHCHIARSPQPPHEISPSIPEAVSAIVMKLLAKLPEDRYQSAQGLQADLARCLAQWQASGRINPFALGANDVSNRFHIPHKLYGREQEIATLLDAFEHMAASGQPGLVTVSGYAGIGKSALVHELHKPIVCEHGHFLSGKFDQLMRDIPYATLTQAFRDLVQQLLAESEARIANWRQQIQAAVGINGQLIVDVLPQVEFIIGKQAPVPALPPAEAQNRFRMVLQRFMSVFCSKEHPLVIFLDDAQWADAASLQFIEDLLIRSDARYLLLITAYRDNEVSAAHPLMATLETIRKNGTAVTDLWLAPLSVKDLNRLVVDTLHASLSTCAPLTALVFSRTEGNPFFFTQFLDALYKEGVLRHSSKEQAWCWDLEQIRGRNFADNVADLMAGKLRRLPGSTQEVLQLAACLGNKFDLHHLALVSGLTEEETGQRLSAAVHEDLILRSGGRGKFLHDRIQQAAYTLIPETRHAEIHLRIGRMLVEFLTADEIDTYLFDVANQFNRGAALLAEPHEKAQVARIDLRAGRKAKASAAYASACVYLGAGMALLDDMDWGHQYELLFPLWLERAECEFQSGHFDVAEQLIVTLLQNAAFKVDQAAVYRLKVSLHVMKAENLQALESGLACLRQLGIDLPLHPTQEQVQAEYEQVWQALGERSIEDILDLPLIDDPEILAAMDVLMAIGTVTVLIDVRLYFLRMCRLVNLSLQHGAASASGYAYVCFGIMLCQTVRRYDEGYRFGRLGCELVEKHGFIAYKAQTYNAMGMNALWTQPIATAIELLQKAICAGAEGSDASFTSACWMHLIGATLMRGAPLSEAWRESEKGMDFVRHAKYEVGQDIIVSQQRFIANMQGRTANFSTFNDVASEQGAFDEAAFETKLPTSSPHVVCRYWLLKMQSGFLAGDLAAALAAAQKAQALLSAIPSQLIPLSEYHYFSALIQAALYESVSADEQHAWRERLMAHGEQLREWADANPATFRDKYALVRAEIARLEGLDRDAIRLYEEAIASARENGFVQYEGIAHEVTAKFYLTLGSATSTHAHLIEARSCFSRWGANGKVRQLEARYPHLRAQTTSAAATNAAVAHLDALAVAKASQAISGRIVLDELIDTLLRILLESAGAQSGALLLARGEDLVLAADAEVAQQAVQVRQHLGREEPQPALPWAIFNYVRRSRTQVLLAEADEPHLFSTDAYLAHRQPKSVLCIPIMRQATLIGLLYLENTLIPHAFTPERVTVLELLASQAAISLENALLYTDLQQENSERKRVEAALREREARIRRLVESNIIGIVLWDVHGNIHDANDAFLRLVGYSREDLQRGAVRWMNYVSSVEAPTIQHHMEELRRTGVLSPYERELFRKDGTRIPVLVGAAFLEGSQENGIAFVLDLSERKRAEAESEARYAAEAANRAKSVFLANMSHELRTPLNGILGYTQILLQGRTLDDKQLRALNIIRQSSEHLLTLINDILDLAKVEAGKLELHRTTISLATFLHGLVEMIGVRAEQKGLKFISDIPPDLPQEIEGDEQRLRQVLLNLLSNAIKFTDRGQVVLRVRFLPPSRLRFEVQDSGVGIRQEQLEAIFQPFEQVGEIRRQLGGTGLGLAISRQFVRLMGSEIQVDSRLGQGSTFWFELDAPTVQADLALPLAQLAVTGYTGPRRKVLVVDDVAENRTVMIDMLSPLGFEIAEAANGRDGLDKAQSERPDLILMDLVMPVMDGWEAMRQLRQLPDFKRVPIVAVSASAFGDDQRNSLAAGANAFLPKPIILSRLLAELGALLKIEWIAAPLQEVEAMKELMIPPAKELEELHHWAKMGNMQEILRWAKRVVQLDEHYRPFADQLSQLAKEYRSKAILNLVEQHTGKS